VFAGIERFIVEFYRAKDDRLFHGLTYAQLIAIGIVVFGVVWMAEYWRVRAGRPGIYGASPSPSPAESSKG
jgi:phosphatidylglycerol:prolipoprotein diacylglycerol transferase